MTTRNQKGHRFPVMASELDTSILYKGVSDLSTWMDRVASLAKLASGRGLFDSDRFKGEAFEHFVECIVTYYKEDSRINCVTVDPAEHNEIGVDLVGKTSRGKIHTHQCKFRSDTDSVINNTDDNISNFPLASVSRYGASYMTVWTTALGVYPEFVELSRSLPGVSGVRAFGNRAICRFVNGNRKFWAFYAGCFLGEKSTGVPAQLDTTFVARDYQTRAQKNFNRMLKNASGTAPDETSRKQLRGRFVYPTGGGKTDIQCLIMRDRFQQGEFGLHLVVAPRIVLVNQLIDRYRGMIKHGYVAVAFHSGTKEPDYEKVKWHEMSTTKVKDIETVIENAKKQGKDNVVVFSTYHSLHKLADSGFVFDTMIADESQYCIAKGFFDSVLRIQADVKLFFTATERHGIGEHSNDNIRVFGKIIGQESPSSLIKKGYLVKPILHAVYGRRRNKEADSFANEAIHIAQGQRKLVHPSLKSKTLFACCETDDVRTIVSRMEYLRTSMPDHDIFTILSDEQYGPMVNGNKVTRDKFMKELRECENDAMIFHYDILSEGIDVDGITGCAVMRNMGHAKLVQTIGRCLRPFKNNTSLKKNAPVSVPVIDGDDKNRDRLREVIRLLMEGGFEVNVEDIVYSNRDDQYAEIRGYEYEPDGQEEFAFQEQAQTVIEDVVHEIEDEFRRQQLEILNAMPRKSLLGKLKKSLPDFSKNRKTIKNIFVQKDYDECAEILAALTRKSDGHSIVTPIWLAETLTNKAKRAIRKKWNDKRIAVLYTMEFSHVLLWKHGVKPKDITYFGDCPKKIEAMKAYGCNCEEITEMTDWGGKKFDMVMGNPPYQKSSNTGSALWPDFVKIGIECLKEDGALVMIHPSNWRDSGGQFKSTQDLLKTVDIEWISAHDLDEGRKTFGSDIRYDMYIAKNSFNAKLKTKFRNKKYKVKEEVNIKDMEFIPNFDMDYVLSLVGGGGQQIR